MTPTRPLHWIAAALVCVVLAPPTADADDTLRYQLELVALSLEDSRPLPGHVQIVEPREFLRDAATGRVRAPASLTMVFEEDSAIARLFERRSHESLTLKTSAGVVVRIEEVVVKQLRPGKRPGTHYADITLKRGYVVSE